MLPWLAVYGSYPELNTKNDQVLISVKQHNQMFTHKQSSRRAQNRVRYCTNNCMKCIIYLHAMLYTYKKTRPRIFYFSYFKYVTTPPHVAAFRYESLYMHNVLEINKRKYSKDHDNTWNLNEINFWFDIKTHWFELKLTREINRLWMTYFDRASHGWDNLKLCNQPV